MCESQCIIIGYFEEENKAVLCALNNLKKDIEKVTDCAVSLKMLNAKENAHREAEACDILVATKNVHTWLDGEEALDKWDGILTPDLFPPPTINFYPVCKPSIRRKSGGLKLFLPDGSSSFEYGELTFCQGGTDRKWFELGNQGNLDVPFTICGCPDWLDISETEGEVITEKRIYLTVRDIRRCAGQSAFMEIRDIVDNKTIKLQVKAEPSLAAVEDCNNVEADGAVCLFADNYEAQTEGANGAYWRKVYGVGRGFGNVMTAYAPDDVLSDGLDVRSAPCLEYSFLLKSEGEFELEITRFLTLDSRGRIRFAIGVDKNPPVVVESPTTDEWRGAWKESVLNNGEKLSIWLPLLRAGKHTLQLYMIDKYVSIHKINLYTERKRDTFFGFSSVHYRADMPHINMKELTAIQNDMYMAADNDILPDVVYVDEEFWKYNRIYRKNDMTRQAVRGARRYEDYYAGNGIADITDMFARGVFQEKDGILSLETEYTLENSAHAYLTPDVSGAVYWSHVRAQTDGGTGLAMQVFGPPHTWDNPKEAPAMHFRVNISEAGDYKAWILTLHEDDMSDTCYFAVDGEILPLSDRKECDEK